MSDSISSNDPPLTISFYEKFIRPQFDRIDERFVEMLNVMNDRFDYLFKKIEDFDQEFVLINHQFRRIDQRFEQVVQRFDQVDQRFEQVDQRFERIDQRFERIDQRLENLEKFSLPKH